MVPVACQYCVNKLSQRGFRSEWGVHTCVHILRRPNMKRSRRKNQPHEFLEQLTKRLSLPDPKGRAGEPQQKALGKHEAATGFSSRFCFAESGIQFQCSRDSASCSSQRLVSVRPLPLKYVHGMGCAGHELGIESTAWEVGDAGRGVLADTAARGG